VRQGAGAPMELGGALEADVSRLIVAMLIWLTCSSTPTWRNQRPMNPLRPVPERELTLPGAGPWWGRSKVAKFTSTNQPTRRSHAGPVRTKPLGGTGLPRVYQDHREPAAPL
jgi:hypothetical protein